MQLFTITIAIISVVQSAVIPSPINDISVSDKIIDDVLAGIQTEDEQEPDWLIEFNKYMDEDDLEFDFEAFMSKMTAEEIEEFFDFFTMMLSDTAELFEDESDVNESLQA